MNRPVIKAIEGLGQLTDFPSMKQGDSKTFCGDESESKTQETGNLREMP